jgi:hypothetical protein
VWYLWWVLLIAVLVFYFIIENLSVVIFVVMAFFLPFFSF